MPSQRSPLYTARGGSAYTHRRYPSIYTTSLLASPVSEPLPSSRSSSQQSDRHGQEDTRQLSVRGDVKGETRASAVGREKQQKSGERRRRRSGDDTMSASAGEGRGSSSLYYSMEGTVLEPDGCVRRSWRAVVRERTRRRPHLGTWVRSSLPYLERRYDQRAREVPILLPPCLSTFYSHGSAPTRSAEARSSVVEVAEPEAEQAASRRHSQLSQRPLPTARNTGHDATPVSLAPLARPSKRAVVAQFFRRLGQRRSPGSSRAITSCPHDTAGTREHEHERLEAAAAAVAAAAEGTPQSPPQPPQPQPHHKEEIHQNNRRGAVAHGSPSTPIPVVSFNMPPTRPRPITTLIGEALFCEGEMHLLAYDIHSAYRDAVQRSDQAHFKAQMNHRDAPRVVQLSPGQRRAFCTVGVTQGQFLRGVLQWRVSQSQKRQSWQSVCDGLLVRDQAALQAPLDASAVSSSSSQVSPAQRHPAPLSSLRPSHTATTAAQTVAGFSPGGGGVSVARVTALAALTTSGRSLPVPVSTPPPRSRTHRQEMEVRRPHTLPTWASPPAQLHPACTTADAKGARSASGDAHDKEASCGGTLTHGLVELLPTGDASAVVHGEDAEMHKMALTLSPNDPALSRGRRGYQASTVRDGLTAAADHSTSLVSAIQSAGTTHSMPVLRTAAAASATHAGEPSAAMVVLSQGHASTAVASSCPDPAISVPSQSQSPSHAPRLPATRSHSRLKQRLHVVLSLPKHRRGTLSESTPHDTPLSPFYSAGGSRPDFSRDVDEDDSVGGGLPEENVEAAESSWHTMPSLTSGSGLIDGPFGDQPVATYGMDDTASRARHPAGAQATSHRRHRHRVRLHPRHFFIRTHCSPAPPLHETEQDLCASPEWVDASPDTEKALTVPPPVTVVGSPSTREECSPTQSRSHCDLAPAGRRQRLRERVRRHKDALRCRLARHRQDHLTRANTRKKKNHSTHSSASPITHPGHAALPHTRTVIVSAETLARVRAGRERTAHLLREDDKERRSRRHRGRRLRRRLLHRRSHSRTTPYQMSLSGGGRAGDGDSVGLWSPTSSRASHPTPRPSQPVHRRVGGDAARRHASISDRASRRRRASDTQMRTSSMPIASSPETAVPLPAPVTYEEIKENRQLLSAERRAVLRFLEAPAAYRRLSSEQRYGTPCPYLSSADTQTGLNA